MNTTSNQDITETVYFNKTINSKPETHLEYSLLYRSAEKRTRWLNGNIEWQKFDSAEEAKDYILKYQTEFVRSNWTSIEISIPNRDQYGNLVAGYIKDTCFCTVRRELK